MDESIDTLKEAIKEPLYNKISEDIEETNKDDFDTLKDAAEKFLQEMKTLNLKDGANYNHQKILNNLIKSAQVESNGNLKINEEELTLYTQKKEKISQEKYIQSSLVLAHKFENSLNEYLNRRIFLTYVTEKGEIIAFNEGYTEEIYNEVSGKKGATGSINISKKKIEKYKKEIEDENNNKKDKFISDLNKKIQNIAQRKNKVFTKAIFRWEQNKGNTDNRYYYWTINKKNGITDIIPNRGYIAEGYADAVINNDIQVTNNKINSSLKRLWEAHIYPESIPAPVKGDIVQKFIKNINQNHTSLQFAIKYGSASTASVSPYIYLANNIIQLNTAPNKDYFKLALPLLVKKSGTDITEIRKDLEASAKATKDNMEKLVYQMVDKIVKSSTTDKAKRDQINVIQENFGIYKLDI